MFIFLLVLLKIMVFFLLARFIRDRLYKIAFAAPPYPINMIVFLFLFLVFCANSESLRASEKPPINIELENKENEVNKAFIKMESIRAKLDSEKFSKDDLFYEIKEAEMKIAESKIKKTQIEQNISEKFGNDVVFLFLIVSAIFFLLFCMPICN